VEQARELRQESWLLRGFGDAGLQSRDPCRQNGVHVATVSSEVHTRRLVRGLGLGGREGYWLRRRNRGAGTEEEQPRNRHSDYKSHRQAHTRDGR
jgi:hypothetical protein